MHYLIQAFIPVANLISRTFGSSCEVVLHDISTPKNSVVYVVGDVTGRQVGQSFDHLITEVILSKDFKDDCTANYYFTALNGREIKSSTALIRDEKGDVVGAICVNIDISAHKEALKILNEFLPSKGVFKSSDVSQGEPEDIMQIVENLVEKIIGEKQAKKLRKDEKKELVKFMDKKGIFAIKGAIDMVANRLNVSRVTIYGYIDEIKKEI